MVLSLTLPVDSHYFYMQIFVLIQKCYFFAGHTNANKLNGR